MPSGRYKVSMDISCKAGYRNTDKLNTECFELSQKL